MSNFYDQFISDDFLTKKASANVVDELSNVSAEVLNKLASEIGAIIEEEDVMNLEEKIASDCESKKEDSEEEKKEAEDSEEKKEDSEEEKKEAEDSEEKKEDSEEEKKEAEDSEEKKEDSEEEKKEAEDSEEKKEDSEEEKKEAEDSEEKKEELTEAEKEELLKKAYELAEEKLAGAGCTLDDYVLNKVADENIADAVIAYSEKLAYVSQKPILQVADDLIDSIGNRFE